MLCSGREQVGVEILEVSAPVARSVAWDVECLLLEIFERLDYSVRAALRGDYSGSLNCTFFVARREGSIIGAAGCLYCHIDAAVCVVGPVGVGREYRGRGVGSRLLQAVIGHLESRNCKAIYLGVSQDGAAASFYECFGFEKYKGIVMRLLLDWAERIEEAYLNESCEVSIRRSNWGDFAQVAVLASCPCDMYTFDFRRGLFSSSYVEPTRFLSVFPEIMRAFSKCGGFANVLVAGQEGRVVGFAQVVRMPGAAQRHVAELEFYVHDNFVEHTEQLVVVTIREAVSLSVDSINCYCLGCDVVKRRIIEAVGGRRMCVLADNVLIGERYEDVVVYELSGSSRIGG